MSDIAAGPAAPEDPGLTPAAPTSDGDSAPAPRPKAPPRAISLKVGNRLHPDIHAHLTAAVLTALDRAGLRRLHTTFTVFLQGSAMSLVAEDVLDMGQLFAPLDQSRVPPEVIGRVLGEVLLYLRARFEIPIGLPDNVSELVISVLAEIEDTEPLTDELCRAVDARLGPAALEREMPPPEPAPPPVTQQSPPPSADQRARPHAGLLVRLNAVCAEALHRTGLDRLQQMMAVCVQSNAHELVVDTTLDLHPLFRTLEQSQIPPEQIGQVLSWILLYAQKELELSIALPEGIADRVVDALTEQPEEERDLPTFATAVTERLQSVALQVARPAWKIREIAAVKKQEKKQGRFNLTKIAAALMFISTVSYWVYFGVTEYRRPVLDPRSKLVWLDPKPYSKVGEVLKVRVSNGVLFVTLPDNVIQHMNEQEQRVLAEKYLRVLNNKDVGNVTLRDSQVQADITLRR